jgi:cyclophilin family peptidyl-prolyl cis-trans isomerase
VATDKRERQKANRQARLAAEQQAATRRRRIRTVVLVGGAVVLILAVLLIVSLVSGDDGDDGEDVAAGATTTLVGSTTVPGDTTPTSSSGASATTAGGAATTAAPGTAACPAADGTSERQTSFDGPPPNCIDPDTVYAATVVTSEGTFVMDLDPSLDEASVNNFVFLARYHFFDGLNFHRVVPGFVIQGGDPSGDGTGGPGYSFTGGTPESSDAYAAGSVSMANSTGPSSNGSQWFVALDDLSSQLQPNYSYFGNVVEGMDVVEAIGALGQGDGPPSREVTIEEITIQER